MYKRRVWKKHCPSEMVVSLPIHIYIIAGANYRYYYQRASCIDLARECDIVQEAIVNWHNYMCNVYAEYSKSQHLLFVNTMWVVSYQHNGSLEH